jgi:hypothetical protein
MNIGKSLFAAAALALSSSAASALTLDFGTATKALTSSLSWSIGGYTVTATAITTDEMGNKTGDSKVAQWGLQGANQGGLGVTNALGDAHTIDGSGALNANDMLIITFSKPVKLNGASFANVDSDDDGSIWADGSMLGTFALIGHPGLIPLNTIGTVFGFGATGQNDDYKLRSLDFSALGISPVPLPPAAALLATGLIGIGSLARRKKS